MAKSQEESKGIGTTYGQVERDTTDIGYKVYHANIIGQGTHRGLHYQNAKYFGCGKFSHLQRNCDQATKGLRPQNAQSFNCEKYGNLQPNCEQGSLKARAF